MAMHRYKNKHGVLTPAPIPPPNAVRTRPPSRSPMPQFDYDAIAKIFAKEIGSELSRVMEGFMEQLAGMNISTNTSSPSSNRTSSNKESIQELFSIDESAVDAGVTLGNIEASTSAAPLAEESVSEDTGMQSALDKLRAKRNK